MFDDQWMETALGDWYCALPGGALARNRWIHYKGQDYWFGDDAVMATNAWVDNTVGSDFF